MKRSFVSRVLFMATVAVAVAGVPLSSAAANLLANPGFEDGGGSYAGWFTFGSGVQLSLPAGDNIIRTGAAASKIYGEFNGCPGAPAFGVGGYGQAFTPVAGSVYQMSGFSYMTSGDPIPGTDTCTKNRAIAKVVFFNAASGGAELSASEIIIGDGNTPLDQWIPFSVSAPVPAGALRVEALILYLQPACDGGAVFVDDLSFEASTPLTEPNLLANPSFPANLTGWSTFGNVYRDARSFLVRTPTGSAKLFSTFVANSPSGMFQSFPAARATAWKLDAWSLISCREDPIKAGNDNYAVARIVFRDAGAVEVGSEQVVIADNGSPLGTWTRHSVIALAPTGTATVEAYILYIAPTPNAGGAVWVDDLNFQQLDPTGVPEAPVPPVAFELHQNMPNPFNPTTRIGFDLREAGPVELSVYDIAGRRVATLFQGSLEPGTHSVTWDGRTDSGPAANGIYRYVLQTASGRTSRSMSLVK